MAFVLLVCWCVAWVSFVFACVFGLLCFSSENSAFNSRFILSNFQLLTDNVSYSIGNAGKKKQHSLPLVADYILGRDIWCTNTAPYAQKSAFHKSLCSGKHHQEW